jgi:nitroreductase
MNTYPCPCCGEYTLSLRHEYEICTNCGWEDDPVQFKDKTFRGGANKMSLEEAKETYETRSKAEAVLENIRTRRSCRSFDPEKEVPHEIIEKIMEAGTWAPTGRGKQSPLIIRVTDKTLRDKLAKMNREILGTENDTFYGAPVVLIVLADKDIPTYIYDGCLVMENLMLAAHALGVDSCWIHRAKEEFESEEGKALLSDLGITGNYEGIGHCILGYGTKTWGEGAARKENYIYRI